MCILENKEEIFVNISSDTYYKLDFCVILNTKYLILNKNSNPKNLFSSPLKFFPNSNFAFLRRIPPWQQLKKEEKVIKGSPWYRPLKSPFYIFLRFLVHIFFNSLTIQAKFSEAAQYFYYFIQQNKIATTFWEPHWKWNKSLLKTRWSKQSLSSNTTNFLIVCSYHVTYSFQSESTLPECQGTPYSKQAPYLKFKWLQLDSNPQQLSS